jgi:proteasome lid subunit RPN8/RPN11
LQVTDQVRIDLNPSLSPLKIPGRVLNELCAFAVETHPEECCGLVTGSPNERFRSVYRCRNDMTLLHKNDPATYPRDGHEAFYMREVDYLEAQKDAEARGEYVSAVFHSHVGAGAYLSQMDLEYAEHALFPFPDAAQIVLAVFDYTVKAAGIFERDLESQSFVGRILEAGTV